MRFFEVYYIIVISAKLSQASHPATLVHLVKAVAKVIQGVWYEADKALLGVQRGVRVRIRAEAFELGDLQNWSTG